MPLPIQYEWSEDEHMLYFVLAVRGANSKNVDIAVCDVFVKVNCHPALFEADLRGEIDPEDPKTRCKVGSGKVRLSLKKRKTGLWKDFHAEGSKEELRARRKQALADAAEREHERLKKLDDYKQDMLKAAEHEQWRLDRENREKIEHWENEEKEKWMKDVYDSFDDQTGAIIDAKPIPREIGDDDEPEPSQIALSRQARQETQPDAAIDSTCSTANETDAPCTVRTRAQQPTEADSTRDGKPLPADASDIWTAADLDDTEEYTPAVRDNPGKIGMRFTERPRVGVPVRDRGMREPPHPKGQVKSDQPPPMLDSTDQDESDPVWLKDKGDNFMVAGDFQGAYNAYTEALKIGTNARAFANRAVADLYLGNLEQCIEDCNHSLKILDLRCKAPPGQIPSPADPEDQVVRAMVHVRLGVAYLWLGAYTKAEEHLQKGLDTEDGLDFLERQKVKEDLASVQRARATLATKDKADKAVRHAHASEGDSSTPKENVALEKALNLYGEALEADVDVAVVYANRCYAYLRAGELQRCLEDADAALGCLKQWPAAHKAPKKPARPARLDPPFLHDPTFVHPDEAKQGEVDWLMKHGGGTKADLPSLPVEYEWVKDVAEKNENSWIAIRKKMTKTTIDAIRRATSQLQDAMYTRKPQIIHDHLKVSIDLNRSGEGPSNRAITEAEKYAEKLESHETEMEAERKRDEEDAAREINEFNLDEYLAPLRSGIAQVGFSYSHCVEQTRRRLYVKVLLRRARALELLGDADTSAAELRKVLHVEPQNPEAKQRLSVLQSTTDEISTASQPSNAQNGPQALGAAAQPSASTSSTSKPAGPVASPAATDKVDAQGKRSADSPDGAEEEEEERTDHASVRGLLASASEYMRRNDFHSALQIYNYARKKCKVWESALTELKVLSNTSLCLQRIRGRLPELISACSEVINRIADIREDGCTEVSEEMLLRMECACLSRRGSAYAQQNRTDDSDRDAATVKQLLARVEQLEAA